MHFITHYEPYRLWRLLSVCFRTCYITSAGLRQLTSRVQNRTTSSTVSSIIPPVINKYSSVVWGDFQWARYRPHFRTTLINKTGIMKFFFFLTDASLQAVWHIPSCFVMSWLMVQYSSFLPNPPCPAGWIVLKLKIFVRSGEISVSGFHVKHWSHISSDVCLR